MIVVYHDVGGTHSTAIAANIHINKLSPDTVPSKEDILALPTFDQLKKKDLGHLIFIGNDEFGSKVYTISRQYKKNLVIPALTDMYSICNENDQGLYVVNTSPTVNLLMKIGGFSSRRLHLVSFGRPIVTSGSLKAYTQIADLVKTVKQTIQSGVSNASL